MHAYFTFSNIFFGISMDGILYSDSTFNQNENDILYSVYGVIKSYKMIDNYS